MTDADKLWQAIEADPNKRYVKGASMAAELDSRMENLAGLYSTLQRYWTAVYNLKAHSIEVDEDNMDGGSDTDPNRADIDGTLKSIGETQALLNDILKPGMPWSEPLRLFLQHRQSPKKDRKALLENIGKVSGLWGDIKARLHL